jgi:CMP/dCMP kinase
VTPGLVIAIDGPAGSGKSSVSRAVATRLGLSYLDTGAMYRAITWAVLQAGIDPDDAAAVAGALVAPVSPRLVSGTDPQNPTIEVDGIDVAAPIRGATVTDAVSAISAVPAIREHLVELQRQYVADSGVGIVVEGRDIGSVVLPDADLKIFLTADPSVRVQRRAAEKLDGNDATLAATESALLTRDAKDSTRAVSPLTRADGAIEVDTTHLTFDEVVDAVVDLASQVSGK